MRSIKSKNKDLIEYFLCVVLSVALVYTVQGAFKIPTALHFNLVVNILFVAALMAILIFGVSAGKHKAIFICIYIVVSLALICVGFAVSKGDNPLLDARDNYFVAACIYVLIVTIVFIFTRKHILALLFLGIVIIACAYIQFMYLKNMLLACAIALISTIMLVVYKNYCVSTQSASKLNSLSYSSALKLGLLISLIPVVAAGLISIAIMATNPGAFQIKLITEYRALEEVKVHGVAVVSEDSDKVVTSSNTTDETRTTRDKKIELGASQTIDGGEAQENIMEALSSGKYSDVNLDSLKQAFQFVSSEHFRTSLPWIILGVICLIFASILLKRVQRRMQFRRMGKLLPRAFVCKFYYFCRKRFSIIGIKAGEHLTSYEFLIYEIEKLRDFDEKIAGPTFIDVTDIFAMSEFAYVEPSSDDLEVITQYYEIFYKRIKKHVGTWRYILLFFRI